MKIQVNLQLPAKIATARISDLINNKGITPEIASLDLEMVKMKMALKDEGESWDKEKCAEVEVEYKRFLHLNKKYPNAGIVPTDEIDTMWHYHILDTRAYIRDSESIFGGYFHHFPYFGLRGEQDELNLKNAFENTKQLYEKEFNEPLLRNRHTDCWHDCQGRCWHACSNDDFIS